MHLEKFQVDKIQNGRLSAIIHLDRPDIVEYHENCSRYLHHYYKTNCKVSGEDAFWKNSFCPSSKWPPIGHYSLSHGRYLVNRARWLDHYYKKNVWFQERMHLEKIWLDKIQNGRLSAIIHFHMADIWSTVLDGWTITINRNVRFQMRMHLEKVSLDQI